MITLSLPKTAAFALLDKAQTSGDLLMLIDTITEVVDDSADDSVLPENTESVDTSTTSDLPFGTIAEPVDNVSF
jgi:hypothetical protein